MQRTSSCFLAIFILLAQSTYPMYPASKLKNNSDTGRIVAFIGGFLTGSFLAGVFVWKAASHYYKIQDLEICKQAEGLLTQSQAASKIIKKQREQLEETATIAQNNSNSIREIRVQIDASIARAQTSIDRNQAILDNHLNFLAGLQNPPTNASGGETL